jgi:hydroxypyruvate reductase
MDRQSPASPSFTDHANHIHRLIQAALSAADPTEAVRRNLQLQDRNLTAGDLVYQLTGSHVYLVAAGKAAFAMGRAAAGILGRHLSAGVLIAKQGPGEPPGEVDSISLGLPPVLRAFRAGHPISDENSLAGTAAVVELMSQTRSGDLVICLISGGASSLLTQPRLSLANWQRLVDALLASGCTINELNAVRKRLDRVKGGGLARLAAPAVITSLVLSDVVGNPLDVIGSGPTVPNPDPPELARLVLERYRVDQSLPRYIWSEISGQLKKAEAETAPVGIDAHHCIVGDVRQAAEAAVLAAKELGFESQLLTANLEGEAREVGRVAAALAKDAGPRSCLVLGGETTVTLHGRGLGGRNQELALAAALALDGRTDVVLASFATDGDDGPTDAAGALVTGQSARQVRQLGLDPQAYLDNNDSYTFFQKCDGLLLTGQTGTNVNDLVFILKY